MTKTRKRGRSSEADEPHDHSDNVRDNRWNRASSLLVSPGVTEPSGTHILSSTPQHSTNAIDAIDWNAQYPFMIQCIRSSLALAAQARGSPGHSHKHYMAPCGYCLFTPHRNSWQVRFRPFGFRRDVDGGVMGGGFASSSSLVHPTVWVARLSADDTSNKDTDEPQKPPDDLIQFILKCAEIRNMLHQAQCQLSESQGCLYVMCRVTKHELDLAPLLDWLNGNLTGTSDRDCISRLLDVGISRFLPEMFHRHSQPGWSMELPTEQHTHHVDNDSEVHHAFKEFIMDCLGNDQAAASVQAFIPQPNGTQEEKKEAESAFASSAGAANLINEETSAIVRGMMPAVSHATMPVVSHEEILDHEQPPEINPEVPLIDGHNEMGDFHDEASPVSHDVTFVEDALLGKTISVSHKKMPAVTRKHRLPLNDAEMPVVSRDEMLVSMRHQVITSENDKHSPAKKVTRVLKREAMQSVHHKEAPVVRNEEVICEKTLATSPDEMSACSHIEPPSTHEKEAQKGSQKETSPLMHKGIRTTRHDKTLAMSQDGIPSVSQKQAASQKQTTQVNSDFTQQLTNTPTPILMLTQSSQLSQDEAQVLITNDEMTAVRKPLARSKEAPVASSVVGIRSAVSHKETSEYNSAPPLMKRKIGRPKTCADSETKTGVPIREGASKSNAKDSSTMPKPSTDAVAKPSTDAVQSRRSSRRIMTVMRFDATPHTKNETKRLKEASMVTGEGFLCPQCLTRCLHTQQECSTCHLQCHYVSGMGVVVSRNRKEQEEFRVATSESGGVTVADDGKVESDQRPPRGGRAKHQIGQLANTKSQSNDDNTGCGDHESKRRSITEGHRMEREAGERNHETGEPLPYAMRLRTRKKAIQEFAAANISVNSVKQDCNKQLVATGRKAMVSPKNGKQAGKKAKCGQEEGDSGTNVTEDHWQKLDHTGLIADYTYGDFVPIRFGPTVDTAVAAIDAQLEELKLNLTSGVDDEEYMAEMKLYNKSVKGRQQWADAERIEKERHKEEYERKLMEFAYQNRNKKKRSNQESEFQKFLTRPVRFTEFKKRSTCTLDEECDICCISSDIDDSAAIGGVVKLPSFHMMPVKDSWNDTRIQDDSADKQNSKVPAQRARRHGRNLNKTNRSMMMLTEMKHSLQFISSYNQGYPSD